MAINGSFNTNAIGSFYFGFSWSRTGYSNEGNFTNIYYQVTAYNTPGYYRTTYNRNLYINGTHVGSSGGAVQYGNGDVVFTGNTTVYHDSAGNAVLNAAFSAGIGTSSINSSGSGSWALAQIIRDMTVTGATDFNDEQNPTMYFTKPVSNWGFNPRMEFAGTTISRPHTYNVSELTFTLTEDERNLLRSKCGGQTIGVRFVAEYDFGAGVKYSWVDRTMSIVNGNPVFTHFTYYDSNSTTTTLTGNSTKLIKGKSNLIGEVRAVNKAVAKKYASIIKYNGVYGTTVKSVNYSATNNVIMNMGTVGGGVLKIDAEDSRGLKTLVEKNFATDIIDYTNLTMNTATIERENGVGTSVLIEVSGKYTNVNFGAYANTITSVQFRAKPETSTSWSGWYNITSNFTIANGVITNKSDAILTGYSFTFGVPYDVEIQFNDRLSQVLLKGSVNSGKTLLSASKEKGICIGGVYDETNETVLQVAGETFMTIAPYTESTGQLRTLPAGDGGINYWRSLQGGSYWCTPSLGLAPSYVSGYGLIEIIKHASEGFIRYTEVSTGYVFTKTFNAANAITNWKPCNKMYLQASIDNTGDMSANEVTLNFTKTHGNVNSLFTLSNGKIRVGKGVSSLKVSATVFLEGVESSESAYVHAILYKNSTAFATSITSGSVFFDQVTIIEKEMTVTEGDLITIHLNNAKNTAGLWGIRGDYVNTRVFIEIIE